MVDYALARAGMTFLPINSIERKVVGGSIFDSWPCNSKCPIPSSRLKCSKRSTRYSGGAGHDQVVARSSPRTVIVAMFAGGSGAPSRWPARERMPGGAKYSTGPRVVGPIRHSK